MLLWRVSRFKDLKGAGGLKAGARWHTAGRPVVYLAESPAGALLEVCVHTAANDIPPEFTLLEVEGPDAPVTTITPDQLAEDWTTNLSVTRAVGDAWLAGGDSALLRVPSVIVPATFNMLLNPLHPQAKAFMIRREYVYPFDVRIKT